MVDDRARVADVYGIARDVPQNYVPRATVDGKLVDSLTRDKHIVIFGSSKQGKTCLRKYNLGDKEYITVTCSNNWTLAQVHSAILKAAGYTIEQSTVTSTSGQKKVNARFDIKAKVAGLFEAGAGSDITTTDEDGSSVTEVALELDPGDGNDIIGALQEIGFSKYIVLEDFHYLPIETQVDFAIALKAFHEGSRLTFLIVGVWLDENRLVQFNGDLTGRVLAVNADLWTQDELREVIRNGEDRLNIRFDDEFKSKLIKNCFDSVYIVQDGCYRVCQAADVHFAPETAMTLGTGVSAREIIRDVVSEQSGRYNSFLTNFAAGFQETRLQMYAYILLTVLKASIEELETGLSFRYIRNAVIELHPDGPALNTGNLTQALRSTASLQVMKRVQPIVLDYDQTNLRLNAVDRGFLVWLQYQDRDALIDVAGIRNLGQAQDPNGQGRLLEPSDT